jgi:hypothetical protein
MNLRESYDYMLKTLSDLYFQTHDNELGGLLGGLDTSFANKPFDPAAWGDWKQAVKQITSDVEINEIQANMAIIELLTIYGKQGLKLNKSIKHLNVKNRQG